MTNIFDNEAKLLDYDIYLIDVYGVIKGGNGMIQGADKRLEQLVDMGKKVVILSNATQKNEDAIKSFAKMGLEKDKHFHEYVTSGDIAFNMISNGKLFEDRNLTKYCQVGIPRKDLFENSKYIETSIDEAQFMYLSIAVLDETDVEKLNKEDKEKVFVSRFQSGKTTKYDSLIGEPFKSVLQKYKEKNLPAFCANPDYIASEKNAEGESVFVIRQGYLAKAYKDIGGEVIEAGKPYSKTYEHTYDILAKKHNISLEELKTKKIAMIGDTIRTDIQGAINSTNELGIKVDSFLTLTGVSAKDIDKNIIDRGNIEEIEKELNSDIKPTYIIKSFGK